VLLLQCCFAQLRIALCRISPVLAAYYCIGCFNIASFHIFLPISDSAYVGDEIAVLAGLHRHLCICWVMLVHAAVLRVESVYAGLMNFEISSIFGRGQSRLFFIDNVHREVVLLRSSRSKQVVCDMTESTLRAMECHAYYHSSCGFNIIFID
jgi:hypothetical protein